MQKEGRKEGKTGAFVRTSVRLPTDVHDRLRQIAKSRAGTVTAYITLACAAYVRRWDNALLPRGAAEPAGAAWPCGWPKAEACYVCGGQGHDPLKRHGGTADDVQEARRCLLGTGDD